MAIYTGAILMPFLYKQEKRDKENIENKSSGNQEGKLLTLVSKNCIINLTKKTG